MSRWWCFSRFKCARFNLVEAKHFQPSNVFELLRITFLVNWFHKLISSLKLIIWCTIVHTQSYHTRQIQLQTKVQNDEFYHEECSHLSIMQFKLKLLCLQNILLKVKSENISENTKYMINNDKLLSISVTFWSRYFILPLENATLIADLSFSRHFKKFSCDGIFDIFIWYISLTIFFSILWPDIHANRILWAYGRFNSFCFY